MSVFLVDLVLKAKMPRDMQSPAHKKLVLLTMAKTCHNDQGVDCFPSRATMAIAAERTERTIDAYLSDLVDRGFISETEKSRRHRPRTFRIHVGRLFGLQPSTNSTAKGVIDRQVPSVDLQPQDASLPTTDSTAEGVLDRQFQAVDLQSENLDLQFPGLDLQSHVATERSERSEERNEQVQGAVAPGVAIPEKGNGDEHEQTYAAMKRLAIDAIDALGADAKFGDLVSKLKELAAQNTVPYDANLGGGVLPFALLHAGEKAVA